MYKLQGERIYLAVLERADCKRLFEEDEYDLEHPTDIMHIGASLEKSDEWYEEIQKLQGNKNVRLGIFLNDGTVIGDVALQDIDRANQTCTLGNSIAKIANRGKGYGKEAARLILRYGFDHLHLLRVSASTDERNIGAQKSLEGLGFRPEGRERKAVSFAGKRYDTLRYGLLREEFSF